MSHYLVKNSLHGTVMTEKLWVSDFEWMAPEEFENWQDYPCILEVDLIHDPECYEKEWFFAVAPVVQEVSGVKKLVQTLEPKKNYILHYTALKCYLRYGALLGYIH